MPVLAGLLSLGAGPPGPALAQQDGRPATQSQGSPAQPDPARPRWEDFPTLQLERLYRGPLRDTIVQRWRDPETGSVCYFYIPISAPIVPDNPSGYAQYGANTIGTMSCVTPSLLRNLPDPR
ncbi:hypothetical protein LPC08_06745 [Roseomonas sp. OT10]|uniref:hypothetical protein n=1 Tax=Roseomonas cutis TaxID=2897332 RepID=UPI001E45E1D6|nr:hypothetical protein [Roseomonas sp. OT10]UFN50316.1 hypothetical protein LPC08_06745 [Roseomonas sp. OT10]